MPNRAGTDPNNRPTLIALSNDGVRSIVELLADTVTSRLLVNATISGTVAPATATGPLAGQAKIAVTGTRVQLASNTLVNGVIVTARSTNTSPITIGGSSLTNTIDGTGNGLILEAGASTSAAVPNTNTIYINGTAGDIISFIGS